jgi:glycosyltransferase involved in cell wall biosynthesis
MPFVTVLTPTYNRAHTLSRVFDSLREQTFADFEWLVIDDGSSDGTEQLIEQFKESASFPIRYFYKPNGGRHTALNFALDKIASDYVINIDSDDALAPNALQLVYDNWKAVPEHEYERFWCISGRCIEASTGEMVGKPYSQGINTLIGRRQHKEIQRYPGEKSCCRKVSVLREYQFPTFSDTKFVSENMVWEKINQRYDQFCTNDVFRIYYTDSADSLTSGTMHSTMQWRTYYYLAQFYLNDCFSQITYNRLVQRAVLSISRCAMLAGTPMKEVIRGLNRWYKKILVLLGYPIAYGVLCYQKSNNKEHR